MSATELPQPVEPTTFAVHRAARVRGASLRAARLVRRDRALALALGVLLLLVALALIGPLVWTRSPDKVDLLSALQRPSLHHPMGTDANGRDVLARFDRGAGISLLAGTVVVIVGALVGGVLGVLAGIAGGRVDVVLMRCMDALLAFPPLILAMAVTIGLGVGIGTACVGIVLTSVPWYARLLRSDVLRIRSLPFVEAGRALGATQRQLISRHIVPHVLPTLLIQAAGVFGFTIVTLAALGFVGLGAQIPTPEWGAMITDGLQYALTGQWWITVFPGIGLLLAVTAANVVADRLRDHLDPRGSGLHA